MLLDAGAVDDLLQQLHGAGVARDELRDALQLLDHAYRWARRQRWTSVDPTSDVRLRDVIT
ncbi:MAG: hypothetical protein ACR2KK_01950 [Acidimicrobiales bacterium]